MIPAVYRVRSKRTENEDTVSLRIEPSEPRHDGRKFVAGQYNMLYAVGIGEVPISISGNPADPGRLVHTIRAVGPVTAALCSLKRGQTLGVRGPFGAGWPLSDALGQDLVIIAGGIGLAPLRPALYRVLTRRADYGSVALLYGARNPAALVYRRDLQRWQDHPDLQVLVTVDAADAAWQGNVGVVTRFIGRLSVQPQNTTAMICGPEVMMRFAIRELLSNGLRPDRIFLSMERNMKCGLGCCGRCQIGPFFVCRDGPVFSYDRIGFWMQIREV